MGRHQSRAAISRRWVEGMTVQVRSAPRSGAHPVTQSHSLPGRGLWWVQPVSVAVGFTLFVSYAAWSVLFGSGGHHWEVGPYLSPFYSPLLKISWFPLSSAILVAWAPLGFRASCYYYR